MRTVLVIGASQGLGLEWVKYYLQQGHFVVATTRNIETATELNALLPPDQILQLDVTKEASVSVTMAQVDRAPDITIYNAGVKGYTKLPNNEKATVSNAQLITDNVASREAGMYQAFEVNAFGFQRVMRELKKHLIVRPKSTVVYVSTGVADTAQNTSGGYPFYRESKAAGEAFARNWYLDCLSETTLDTCPRIFSIIPGLVDTGMGKDINGAVDPGSRVAEMAAVIENVRISGDTHGVWKYNNTKCATYHLPDIIEKTLAPQRSGNFFEFKNRDDKPSDKKRKVEELDEEPSDVNNEKAVQNIEEAFQKSLEF